MSPGRVLLVGALLGIALVAIAAWLLNVPLAAITIGVALALLGLFLWLSRHGAGKRSGEKDPEKNSRAQ